MTEIQTDRLLLRPWRESDFEPMAAFFADPVLAKHVGGTKSSEQTWRTMAYYIGHWHLKGFGYWAVEEKSSGEFVGGTGLWKSPEWPELELGYWMRGKMHGKGYATEAATRAKQYAFEELGISTLVSYIDPKNTASIKVAERVGGTFDTMIELLDFGPHCVYRYSG